MIAIGEVVAKLVLGSSVGIWRHHILVWVVGSVIWFILYERHGAS